MTARTTPVAALMALALAARAFAGGFVDKPFPDFSAIDAVSGEPLKLSDFRGRVVLVDFWATWCAPCRAELPKVRRLWNDYRDKGLEIIGISLDTRESRFQGYVRQNGMDWHHVFEGAGWRSRFAQKYRVRSIPRAFVIGPDGTCLAETNRIGNVESLIAKAVSEIDPDALGAARADLPPGIDLRRLREIEAELEGVVTPLRNFEQSLGLLERVIGGLDRELRTTGSTEGLDRRYRYLLHQLTAARRELFTMGLLAEAPELPGNPFAAAGTDGAVTAGRVADALQTARDMLVPLRQAVAGGLGRVEPLLQRLRELDEQAPEAEPETWMPRVDAAEREAEAVVAALARGTEAAIERIDERLADYLRQTDEQARLLESMCLRLSGLENDLAAALEGSVDPAALRSAVVELTAELNALAELHGVQASLDDDPFNGRNAIDDEVAAAVAAHLRAADEAAGRLDAAVVARRAALADLALEARALLATDAEQVAEVTVKRRIDALTDRILALATGS